MRARKDFRQDLMLSRVLHRICAVHQAGGRPRSVLIADLTANLCLPLQAAALHQDVQQ